MSEAINQELDTLIRARYSLLYVVTWEEQRVEQAIRKLCQDRGKRVQVWSVTQGLVASPTARDPQTRSPLAALDAVDQFNDAAVFIFKDFHAFISDEEVKRRLRDLTHSLKTTSKTLIILAPSLKLPAELEKDITVIDYPLPDIKDLDNLLNSVINSVKGNAKIDTTLDGPAREGILKAAQGLTANEAENVFARSLVSRHSFDVDVVLSEKEQIIRKSGMLEYYRQEEGIADVGGLELLKEYVGKRTEAFSQRAIDFGLPAPKGILLLGVQGCGKSLCCKAVASKWRLPLLRLDVGRVFGGIVGQSEENMRRAIRISESIAPCVLWLDELEKGFAGTQSSGISDGGTTARVFASFITWMQEKKAPVFVVATANRIEDLPPELLRKGRFDEIFFVDLPRADERREIFEIHVRKRKRDPAKFDLAAAAQHSDGYSGAEIEQVVVSSLFDAFDAHRDITTEDLLHNIHSSVPLSRTMREQIAKLREWAGTRARNASLTDEVEPTPKVLPQVAVPEVDRPSPAEAEGEEPKGLLARVTRKRRSGGDA